MSTFEKYQAGVMRTANRGTYPDWVPEVGRRQFDLMTWGLGIAGEAGEVADLIKKGIGHDAGLDRPKLIKELGDCLWYIGAIASAIEINLAEVAQANTEKLLARYPNGFSTADSIAKADERTCSLSADTCRNVPDAAGCATHCYPGYAVPR